MSSGEKSLKVAVLGCGAVGSQVVRLLTEQHDDLAARVGVPVELVGIAVRRLAPSAQIFVLAGLFGKAAAAAHAEAGLVPVLNSLDDIALFVG